MSHAYFRGINSYKASYFIGKDFKIFSSYAQLYTFCAIYGRINGVYSKENQTPSEGEYAGMVNEIRSEYLTGDMRMYRRLILLTEEITSRTDAEKIDATFRYDFKDHEIEKQNDDIIEWYAIGGLNKLYDKFKNLDDKESITRTFDEILDTMYKDFGLIEVKDDFDEFDEDYL